MEIVIYKSPHNNQTLTLRAFLLLVSELNKRLSLSNRIDQIMFCVATTALSPRIIVNILRHCCMNADALGVM